MLDFLKGAEVIIHNAPFDTGFINAELKLADPSLGQMEDYCQITDTLVMARDLHPGQRNSLDALCKRYEVDNSQRNLHGALLDAKILAQVYLGMTGGQTALGLRLQGSNGPSELMMDDGGERPPIGVIMASGDELQAHEQRLGQIEESSESGCLWLQQMD